jgi:hypothetical protein
MKYDANFFQKLDPRGMQEHKTLVLTLETTLTPKLLLRRQKRKQTLSAQMYSS